MPAKPESRLIASALQLLALRGWHAIRVNAGMQVVGRGSSRRVFKGAEAGTADIIACSPTGKYAAFEGKVGRNKTTAKQDAFLQSIRERGGIAGVFRDLDELEGLMGKDEG